MNITRCPSCNTAFKVYPEQLAMREGQVRCGWCATVFDARAAMLPEPKPEEPPIEESSAAREEEIARIEATAAVPVPARVPAEHEVSTDTDSDFEFGPQSEPRFEQATVLWMIGSVVLFLALVAQLLYAYRSELATLSPTSRSWLEATCRRFGCTVPLPRYANLISIESSELTAERGASGLFTLAAILRNRAGFPQAYPAFELTLTDSQDRPIARRVLRPDDYLDDPSARRTGLAANSEYALKLNIDASELGATGYRLYAFFE